MSEKRYQPRTKQQRTRSIKHNIENFSGGMVKDVDPAEIPKNSVAHLENAMGFTDSVKGRVGTRLFANRRLPVDRDIMFTKRDEIITIIGTDSFTRDDVGKIIVNWNDGENKSFTILSLQNGNDGSFSEAVVSDTETQYTTSVSGHIRGVVNGTKFDVTRNMFYLLIGAELYVSEVTIDSMSEWNPIVKSGKDELVDSVSSFSFISDSLFLLNSGGIFRITTDTQLDDMYYWKTNGVVPLIENKIESNTRTNVWQFGYRYISTLSRFKGGSRYQDRTDGSDGVILEQETCPPSVTRDEKDYSTLYTMFPPNDNTVVVGGVVSENQAAQEANVWQEYEQNSFSIRIENKQYDKVTDVPVYVDFTNAVSLADVLSITQSAINQFSSSIKITVVNDDSNNTRFILYVDGDLKNDGDELVGIVKTNSDVIPTREKEVPVDPDDPSQGTETTIVPLYGNDVFSIFQMDTPSKTTVHKSRRNIVKGLTHVDERTGESQTESMTHYSIYRSLDTSAVDDESGSLSLIRPVNNPERFIWVADIPMIVCFDGFVMNGHLYTDNNVVTTGLIGSMVSVVYGGVENVFEIMDIVESPNDMVYTRRFKLNMHIDIGNDADLASCVVGTKGIENVFLCSRNSGGVVVSDHTFDDDDVGKYLFWANGGSSIIRSVDNGIATTLDVGTLSEQTCAYNPIGRNFNDVTDDEKLLSRLKPFPLRTRFYDRMVDTNVGIFIPGFLVVAARGFGDVIYGSTNNLYDIGYHHTLQVSNKIDTGVESISYINSRVSIKTKHQTFAMSPLQTYQAGDPVYNESFFVIPDPEIISDTIGVSSNSHLARVDDGTEIVFTTEPAIRFFDGDQYGNNITSGKVHDSYIARFRKKIIMDYDGSFGIYIWGHREEESI